MNNVTRRQFGLSVSAAAVVASLPALAVPNGMLRDDFAFVKSKIARIMQEACNNAVLDGLSVKATHNVVDVVHRRVLSELQSCPSLVYEYTTMQHVDVPTLYVKLSQVKDCDYNNRDRYTFEYSKDYSGVRLQVCIIPSTKCRMKTHVGQRYIIVKFCR